MTVGRLIDIIDIIEMINMIDISAVAKGLRKSFWPQLILYNNLL